MSFNDTTFPVTYSTPCAEALLERVRKDYRGLLNGKPVECRFLSRGLNDVFEIVTDKGTRYVLRVYRAHHRGVSAICYELEVLLHLQQKSAAVSVPLMRKDGNWLGELMMPERKRFSVLFTYAEGEEASYEGEQEEAQAVLYGREAAKLHDATDDFQCDQPRFTLDLEHLLWEPMELIQPFFSKRPDDWKYLEVLANKLERRLKEFDLNQFSTGLCHGDLHGGNAHFYQSAGSGSEDKLALTFFDFDCCGIGLRAYDIAVFRWNARHKGKDTTRWPLFLKGYQQVRELSDAEVRATDVLVPIRQIWLMGLHVGLTPDFSVGWLNDGYFNRSLAYLKTWEEEFLSSETGTKS